MIGGFVIALILLFGWFWHTMHHKPDLTETVKSRRARQAPAEGWVYFACGSGTPVLVGTSIEEPTGGSVPVLRQQPQPMRVVHKVHTNDLAGTARRIVSDLAPYHVREGWFDRDAALFYVDHLKGAA